MTDPRNRRERPLNKSILLAVADPLVRELLTVSFSQAGFFVLAPDSVAGAHKLTREVRADAMVLDIDADPSFVAGMRSAIDLEAYRTVPRFLLAADCESPLLGATDEPVECIQKPFSPRDAVAQVLLGLRPRTQGLDRRAMVVRRRAPRLCRLGDLELDVDRQEVRIVGTQSAGSAELSPRELHLLEFLMKNSARTLSREEIVRALWGDDSDCSDRTVDQCVKRLRHSLASIGAEEAVKTMRGYGYRMEPILHRGSGSAGTGQPLASTWPAVDELRSPA